MCRNASSRPGAGYSWPKVARRGDRQPCVPRAGTRRAAQPCRSVTCEIVQPPVAETAAAADLVDTTGRARPWLATGRAVATPAAARRANPAAAAAARRRRRGGGRRAPRCGSTCWTTRPIQDAHAVCEKTHSIATSDDTLDALSEIVVCFILGRKTRRSRKCCMWTCRTSSWRMRASLLFGPHQTVTACVTRAANGKRPHPNRRVPRH